MPISRCDCAGYRLILGLALVVATWFALMPQPIPLHDVPFGDKWAHLITYLVLAFLIDASWPDRSFDCRKWLPLLGYGLLIELTQNQIPNREFSVADLLANAAGILIYGAALTRTLRLIGIR